MNKASSYQALLRIAQLATRVRGPGGRTPVPGARGIALREPQPRDIRDAGFRGDLERLLADPKSMPGVTARQIQSLDDAWWSHFRKWAEVE